MEVTQKQSILIFFFQVFRTTVATISKIKTEKGAWSHFSSQKENIFSSTSNYGCDIFQINL